jgi:hypothetical protein
LRQHLQRLLAAVSPTARADRRNIGALATRHGLPWPEAERLYRRSRAMGYPAALAELEGLGDATSPGDHAGSPALDRRGGRKADTDV